MKIHLDTDLGGDIDDICALAMLLRWPQEIQITALRPTISSTEWLIDRGALRGEQLRALLGDV
jgi:hypothetical protein